MQDESARQRGWWKWKWKGARNTQNHNGAEMIDLWNANKLTATNTKMAVGLKSRSDEVGIIKRMYERLILILELVYEICNI